MSQLGKIADSIDAYNAHVAAEVKRARTDAKFAAELRAKWAQLRASVEMTKSPSGTPLPRLALPDTDEPGAIAEYLLSQGFPGQFPYATAALPRDVSRQGFRGRARCPQRAVRI
jgi:hypothetical protein